MEGRVPPHSAEAEKSVLGAAMLSKDALFDVMEVVKPADFYDENHKEIFQAMIDLNRKNAPVDALTVAEELKKRNSLEMVGGRAYIASLSSMTPTTSNAMEYGRIVAEKASVRRLIETADDIVTKGYDGTMDANQMLDYAESGIFEISQARQKGQYSHIRDVLVENLAIIDRAEQMDGGLTGITTGFSKLDEMTSGMQKSDLIILAARPAMGKSAFVLNIATNAALKAKVPVAIFSLEMSKEQMVNRILCSEAMVDSNKVRTGKLDDDDWVKLAEAIGPLSEAEIYIDDTPGISVMEIRAKCRKLKLEKNIGLVIIDYLQLVQGSNKRNGSREQEISEISRSLKILAKEIGVPVIALSQLSRAVEQRPDHKPMLSDLRESGAIEQDADLVMFLYRDDYYNPESEKKDIAEVIIAKHRGGSLGTAELLWLGSYTKFVNLERRFDD